MLRVVEDPIRPAENVISLPAMVGSWLTTLTAHLVDRMERDGIEDPLAQPITVAAVLADLFDVAGAPVPVFIADLVGPA